MTNGASLTLTFLLLTRNTKHKGYNMTNPTLTKASDRTIKANLDKWYLAASPAQHLDGMKWYNSAQAVARELAYKYEIDPYIAACVISALSPNNRWERNIIDASNVIDAWSRGLSAEFVKVCTYHANKIKAFNILNDIVDLEVSSRKTHSFAMNVGNLSDSHVTVDKWHARACLFSPKANARTDYDPNITTGQYNRVERITAQLAKKYELSAYQFQAIIWVVIRENWS